MPRIRSSSLFGTDQLVDVVEPDSGRVLRIWWALVWRALFGVVGGTLLGSGAAFIGALFLGMVGAALGLPGGTFTVISQAFGVTVSSLLILGATIVAVGSVLRKEFRGFRLVLLEVK